MKNIELEITSSIKQAKSIWLIADHDSHGVVVKDLKDRQAIKGLVV